MATVSDWLIPRVVCYKQGGPRAGYHRLLPPSWALEETASCECGNPQQTMSRTIDDLNFYSNEEGLLESTELQSGLTTFDRAKLKLNGETEFS